MNKAYNLQLLLLLTIPLLLVKCVSLNSHQTGRSLGEGYYSVMGSFNFGNIDAPSYSLGDSVANAFYLLELSASYGLTEKLDVGVKVNTSSYYTVTGKYQFLGTQESKFASSVGLDLGGGFVPRGTLGFNYNTSLSWYNSIHPKDYLAFTLSPRYHYLSGGSFSLLEESTQKENTYALADNDNIYGYSAGVILGKKEHRVSIELSQYVNNQAFSFASKPIISIAYIWSLR